MNTRSQLERYGVNRENIRDLAEPSPDVLDYLDLVDASGDGELHPDGVIESSNRPILYYVNATRLADSADHDSARLRVLSRNVACRGERAYLAIVKPGKLEVTPVFLEDKEPSWRVFEADSPEAINFFTNLVHANIPDYDLGDPNLVFDEMLHLLETGADRIRSRIGKANTLSLIGRALFFRFLYDREIVTDNDVPNICQTADTIKECFDNAENAYRTSRWLDETFNGDLLPFNDRPTREFFKGLNRSAVVFQNVSAIIRGDSPVGSDEYQRQFDWATFDFAHVPVGLLSQVYEAFSWKWEKEESGATSVHYTPRNIAKTIVNEVFDGLENAHQARILDPACGAGVFLVLAFRRIYRELWRSAGERPDTRDIRRILEKQICGFDISDSALRLAALSLYLTAVELDPKPVPPGKLRFRELDNLVLFNHRTSDDKESGPVIGSLGEHVSPTFNGSFDIIVSNPPWTSISGSDDLAAKLNTVSKNVVARRDAKIGDSYQNPDNNPDLPFLWKATEWCKTGGRIAMALHSRVLFQNGNVPKYARDAIFQLMRVTGIVNCSNVRKTKVWPNMDQPFFFFFAENQPSELSDNFLFLSPQSDSSLNAIGELRVDPDSARQVAVAEVLEKGWILKTLSIGTILDVEVVSKILESTEKTIDKYWLEENGLFSRRGYTVGRNPDQASSEMKVLPDLSSPKGPELRFTIQTENYAKFDHDFLTRTRLFRKGDRLQPYRAPLFVLRKSLPKKRSEGNSRTCYEDIAFNQDYYGYSASKHPNGKLLIQYLNLFAHCNVWTFFALCTSSSLGTERPVFLKSDFDGCPFIPLETLNHAAQRRVGDLALKLEGEDESVFDEIDLFFAELYGLDKRDLQVVSDTLDVRNPHDELGSRGSAYPTENEKASFIKCLEQLVRPYAQRINANLSARKLGSSNSAPFCFLEITDKKNRFESTELIDKSTLELALKTGASRIVRAEFGRVIVGILNQYRYWTRSRVRLLAADVLRNYFSVFEAIE